MLGPNGAGKTTTISCLTGINPVTAGDGNSFDPNFFPHIIRSLKLRMCNMKHFSTALVYDQSIRSSMGMTNIRRMMGVCPQVTLSFLVLSSSCNLLFSRLQWNQLIAYCLLYC